MKWKNEEKVIMQASGLLATRRNGAAWRGCSVRNKILVERNNRSSPNSTTPYGVECGGGNAVFYQYMNPNGFCARFCKSPVAEARNEYTYSASGQKLKVVQKWNPNFSTAPAIGSAINTATLTESKTTDYIGNMIYENGALKRILFGGGYVEGGVYHYYLTDHLGNNRLVVNSSGTVVQKNHYYPFGTAFAETPVAEQGKQPYKFGDKELDQMSGLNWYDFSARPYMSDLLCTSIPDRHSENYYSLSPYSMFANNPLRYTDPTGMDWLNGDDKNYAKKMQQEMTTLSNSEFGKIVDKFGDYKMAISNGDTKKADALMSEMKSMGENVKNLEAGVSELKAMGDTKEQKFTFNKIDGDVGGTDKNKDGVIVMEIAGNGDIANGVHEASHGYDIWMNGATTIGMKGNMIQREVKAYSRQFSYDKKSLPATYDQSEFGKANSLIDINNRWVLGIKSGGEYIYIKKMYPNENPNDLIKRIK